MKTKMFLFLLLLFIIDTANAQLRVLSNGRVQAGLLKDTNEDLGNVTNMQIFGRYGDMRAGSKMSFGDFGQQPNNGWNVFIGEYGTADTDQLWLHGKLGFYLTSTGSGNNIVAYYNPSANANFIFNTNLRVNGVNITSDTKLKDNISSIQNPLGLLSQLNGVTYTYKLSEIQDNRKPDNSKFTGQVASDAPFSDAMQGDVGNQLISDSKYSDKINKDKQIQALIDQKETEEANRKRIGFLAQDIQKVLPELVHADEKGTLSIDYIGFIPLLVESLKEMQGTIDELKEEIRMISGDNSKLRSDPTGNESINPLEGARLYNREGASVGYSLPADFTSANLQIFDTSGKMVKAVNLDAAGDRVEIYSSETGLGTFIYALFVDGEKRDTLKKFINR